MTVESQQNGIEYFAKKFVQEFNISNRYFLADVAESEEIMSSIYLEPVWCFPLEKLLITGSDIGRIKKYISFAGDMYKSGDNQVKGVVQWVMLEYFVGFDIKKRSRFYKHLSHELYDATKDVERYLKNIHDKLYPELNYQLLSAK